MAADPSEQPFPQDTEGVTLPDIVHAVVALAIVGALGATFYFSMSKVVGIMVWVGLLGYAVYAGWRGQSDEPTVVPRRPPASDAGGPSPNADAPLTGEPVASS